MLHARFPFAFSLVHVSHVSAASAFRFITFTHLLCISVLVKHLIEIYNLPPPRGEWHTQTRTQRHNLSSALSIVVVFLLLLLLFAVHAFLHILPLSVFYCCSYPSPYSPPLHAYCLLIIYTWLAAFLPACAFRSHSKLNAAQMSFMRDLSIGACSRLPCPRPPLRPFSNTRANSLHNWHWQCGA